MSVEQAIQTLKNANFCVELLMHISDIKQYYHCTDKEAMQVLTNVSNSQGLEDLIDDEAYNLELKIIENEI